MSYCRCINTSYECIEDALSDGFVLDDNGIATCPECRNTFIVGLKSCNEDDMAIMKSQAYDALGYYSDRISDGDCAVNPYSEKIVRLVITGSGQTASYFVDLDRYGNDGYKYILELVDVAVEFICRSKS